MNDLFADSGRQLLALRGDAGVLAASFPGGTLKLFDLESSDTVTLYDGSEFTGFSGGFLGTASLIPLIHPRIAEARPLP